jgi:hypothetical protein
MSCSCRVPFRRSVAGFKLMTCLVEWGVRGAGVTAMFVNIGSIVLCQAVISLTHNDTHCS